MSQFTASDWIAVFGALGVLITVFVTQMQKILAAISETKSKLGTVEQKASAIETLVDGRTSRMEAEITALRSEVKDKMMQIAQKDQAAALREHAPAAPAEPQKVEVINEPSDPVNIKPVPKT